MLRAVRIPRGEGIAFYFLYPILILPFYFGGPNGPWERVQLAAVFGSKCTNGIKRWSASDRVLLGWWQGGQARLEFALRDFFLNLRSLDALIVGTSLAVMRGLSQRRREERGVSLLAAFFVLMLR